MANSIPQKQNEEKAVRLLASQKRVYGLAKFVLVAQIILVVIVPGILLIAEHFCPRFNAWAAFMGITISAVDAVLLEPVKANLRRKAAVTQELFDCYVLNLEWPLLKTNKPDREDVYLVEPTTAEREKLRDWYPPAVGQLPLYVARIICQRSNCWWDSKQRRFYSIAVVALSAMASVGVLVVALAKNLAFQDFVLSLMAPILPLVLWGIREAREQSEAALRVDQLKRFGDEFWERLINQDLVENAAVNQSRRFQDEIFEHRRQSPMIFDWFYALLRDRFEHQMTQGAAEMIQEAQQKGL
jgi:hypothetical protein